ncbi:MAG: cell division protein FtsL [Candidatus Wallbacteria bacterium HGW-Wallbacteria-1]|jgi:cell division protein FtsL|uniref:Cell division protein FtsL n=1 Tax=Candidatus Wallbacteria bacterium HGW-Wallbacteria-1 TaxID=2013854 RepID=A0A2N1PQC5_9BACT|nr:MAG: cell division protein FtsL [Candidatus Wallbacteria bacterium HGW-Wallbacteria-1]
MRSDNIEPSSARSPLSHRDGGLLAFEPDRILDNKLVFLALSYLLMVMVILFLLFLHVRQNEQMARINLEISKVEKENILLKREINDLTIKTATLSALDRVEKIAREKLGMIAPENSVYVDLSGNEK